LLDRREIRIGRVEFDITSRDLRDADGVRIKLRNKSSEVLACLADKPGQIVQKSQIMEAVWPNVTVSDESLTQCIAEIRRAIGDVDQTLLATHIGKGYCLNPAEAGSSSRRKFIAHPAALIFLAFAALLLPALSYLWLHNFGSVDRIPRIAILRFENLSSDAGQAYFGEGLAEDLITDLTRIEGLQVLSPNSSFAVEPNLPMIEISRQLDVSYILSGSVRRAGDSLRITARLTDVGVDVPIWAERFDGRVTDVFSFQDQIRAAVIAALRINLTDVETIAVSNVDTQNPAAFDAYLRGMRSIASRRRLDVEAVQQARTAFNEAIRLDPDYALAYGGLAWAEYIYFETINYYNGPETAYDLANRSMAIAENALAHRTLSKRHFNLLSSAEHQRNPKAALRHLEAARRLQPGDPDLLADIATTLPFVGRPKEAVEFVRQAMKLNPAHPDWYYAASGVALLLSGNAELAIRDLQRWAAAYPSHHIPYLFLASAYGLAGQENEAKAAIDRHNSLSVPFSLEAINHALPMATTEREFFQNGLKAAGVK
jgi:TolB-like protein/DNA-binding winged helix-turn-helix (wHTH) protein/Flp pilus assembly protein TadD